ncbi:GtrA family protein [Pseudomonas izuensis]|uniref:GtrA family protein n=1 Tax=Pseudomonas izuensis TaxID=2684212 RepID=UPI0013585C56
MKQLIKFIFVGVLNTLLGYAIIFSCMYLLGATAVVSNVIGYATGLVLSYVLNRKITFQSTSKSRSEIFRFLLVFLVAYFSNLGVLLMLIRIGSVHEGLAQVLAGIVYVFVSFFLNKYYVFYRTS